MTILGDHVLVLNKYFLAGQVTTVMSSIKVLYKNHAKVVDENMVQYTLSQWAERSKEIIGTPEEKRYTGLIRSPSIVILAPQVIFLPYCETTSKELETVKYSRKNIFLRDGNQCQYCGKKFPKSELTLDHINPKSRGGRGNFHNIVAACMLCNAHKADRTPEEAGMRLIKKPVAPKWKSHVGTPFSKVKREYWKYFLE